MSELRTKTNADTDEILCRSERKPVDTKEEDLLHCIYDATPPIGVYVRSSVNDNERDSMEHAFLALSEKFGKHGKIQDVFELFGEFEPGLFENIL